ncbi:unnamed protein product [Schistocephalus solidus]|uniref:Uncharacterized protein n=1 Tax=Schistocephalus solidus TaxID=70667 RepID=A0A183SE38_SCHSO|nr:unnamed protein product [Schistocephalus solidus]
MYSEIVQDAWMIRKAEEIQVHADRNEMKNFIKAIKTTYGPSISDAAIGRLPHVDTNNDLDLPPSLPETSRAVQQISSGKAPGSDAIPPKGYKDGGPRLMAELTTLFQEMWRQGQVRRISKTRQSSISTNGRGIGNSVIITEASRQE